jgi:heme exporter protein A
MSAPAAGPLLRLDDVSCERDGRLLFQALTVALGPGDCLELRGPNGSGKSTLLRAVAGLYPDVSGTIHAPDSLYLGHRPGISALLTAEENLRWYAGIAPAAGDGPAAAKQGAAGAETAAALDRVGMAGYERVACQHMSAGQQRRVGLARLLICPARLWLLDEPFTALDAAGQDLVRSLIDEHRRAGGAVLCATHQGLKLPGAGSLNLALGLTGPEADG